MANIADCTYTCVGSKEALTKLNEVLRELDKKSSRIWVGNILLKYGVDPTNIPCRGNVYYFDLGDDYFTMDMEWAWGESQEFRDALEKAADVKIYYIMEEPSCDVFCSNDIDHKFFKWRFYLSCNEQPDEDHFENVEALAEFLSKFMGKTIEPKLLTIKAEIQTYEEEQQEKDPDSYINLHEFSYAED